jgi:hypothetical protein
VNVLIKTKYNWVGKLYIATITPVQATQWVKTGNVAVCVVRAIILYTIGNTSYFVLRERSSVS